MADEHADDWWRNVPDSAIAVQAGSLVPSQASRANAIAILRLKDALVVQQESTNTLTIATNTLTDMFASSPSGCSGSRWQSGYSALCRDSVHRVKRWPRSESSASDLPSTPARARRTVADKER